MAAPDVMDSQPPDRPVYIAPDIRTPQVVVEHMLRLAEVGPDDVIFDLGSGDGRIVITAAKEHGARGVGIEIDQKLVAEARQNASSAGVESLVRFEQGDLLQGNLEDATVVALYLWPSVNRKVRPILERDLDLGDRVITHQFEIEGWHYSKRLTIRDDKGYLRTMYLYVVGEHLIPPKELE
jgi:predicted RNA methylase